jgi:hypothetical protein
LIFAYWVIPPLLEMLLFKTLEQRVPGTLCGALSMEAAPELPLGGTCVEFTYQKAGCTSFVTILPWLQANDKSDL